METKKQPKYIDKKLLASVVLFAIRNVPDVDEFTLNKLLELVNTSGSFGSITASQLQGIMNALQKYVPNTCERTLEIFIELLNIHIPSALQQSNGRRPELRQPAANGSQKKRNRMGYAV